MNCSVPFLAAYLLVAALYTAFTLAKVDDFRSVAKNLSVSGTELAYVCAYMALGNPLG